ncbi:MAG: hypothetical protein J6C92_09855 [Bacteroidaceae bacterium]|nr:hypothetical protein [Bacteroidaceae bacterium]
MRRPFALAAMVSVMLLLVGCTIAYANGWFAVFFSNRTGEPLSDDQLEYINENEQIIKETRAANGWTVELKSAITDGETGYILFGIAAPDDIDLEANLGRNILDGEFISPGNNSLNNHMKRRRTLIVPSTGPISEELNYFWQDQSYWEADNDGLSNTLNYMIEIRCEKMYPDRECLLEAPFGSDITFNVRFIDFTYEYEDPEIRKALDDKYAGQDDYLIGGEEMEGLHKSDILVEGEWEFNINFGMDDVECIELISAPITVEAIVYRKLENGTMFFDTTHALEQVKLSSFRLTSFGAMLMFEEDEDMIGEFIEYQNKSGYEDRCIYVVMKDGSQIALETDGAGTVLTAESPIVLDNVDYVLLGDGTKLNIP